MRRVQEQLHPVNLVQLLQIEFQALIVLVMLDTTIIHLVVKLVIILYVLLVKLLPLHAYKLAIPIVLPVILLKLVFLVLLENI